MITTLLFDLDGTLLPMDNDYFTKEYFKVLVPYVMQRLPKGAISPEEFVQKLWASTETMVRDNNREATNEEVFRDHFLATTGFSKDQIWGIVESFYETTFGELDHLAGSSSLSKEICEAALAKGYKLVLATNPLFPETAIRHRMRWAGIGHIPFTLVTTLEKMHFCKPNPNYYKEIAEDVGVEPQECLMFGNDVYEDGMAVKVGMQGFLVTDCIKDSGNGDRSVFDYVGTMQDVLQLVREQLPDVSNL